VLVKSSPSYLACRLRRPPRALSFPGARPAVVVEPQRLHARPGRARSGAALSPRRPGTARHGRPHHMPRRRRAESHPRASPSRRGGGSSRPGACRPWGAPPPVGRRRGRSLDAAAEAAARALRVGCARLTRAQTRRSDTGNPWARPDQTGHSAAQSSATATYRIAGVECPPRLRLGRDRGCLLHTPGAFQRLFPISPLYRLSHASLLLFPTIWRTVRELC
jgi:hypothetical protein